MRKKMGICFILLAICSVVYGLYALADCEYCEDIKASLQLCDGVGSNQPCGIYYYLGETICCSNRSGTNCANYSSYGPYTFYYKETTGTVSSCIYRCKNATSNPCAGDVIVPSGSYSCTPVGDMMDFSGTYRNCNE